MEPIDLRADENGKADAKLIAAAPDLLEALIGLMNSCGRPENPGTDLDAYEEAEAAVRKARGQQS